MYLIQLYSIFDLQLRTVLSHSTNKKIGIHIEFPFHKIWFFIFDLSSSVDSEWFLFNSYLRRFQNLVSHFRARNINNQCSISVLASSTCFVSRNKQNRMKRSLSVTCSILSVAVIIAAVSLPGEFFSIFLPNFSWTRSLGFQKHWIFIFLSGSHELYRSVISYHKLNYFYHICFCQFCVSQELTDSLN